MMKKLTILFVCLVVAVLSYAVWKFVFPHDKTIDLDRIENLISEGTIEAAIDGERVSFIDGNFTSQTVADSADAASVLNSASALFGDSFHADAEDFISQPYDDGAFQANYYRYCPSINGVPVLGSQIILSADRDSNVTSLFSSYVPEIEKVDTVATITADEASDIAVTELLNSDAMSGFIDSLTGEAIAREDVIVSLKSVINVAPDLIIYAVDDSESPRLVYAVSVDNILDDESIEGDYEVIAPDENPDMVVMPIVSDTYYIAANGEDSSNIINTVSDFKAADWQHDTWQHDTYRLPEDTKSSDEEIEEIKEINVERNGDRIRLHDTERNISIYQAEKYLRTYVAVDTLGLNTVPVKIPLWFYIKGDIVTANENEVPENAFMAQYNVAQAYDFYKHLDRISYDNKGASIPVLLGYESADNAQWSFNRKQIEIKSGGSYEYALDLIGHEFTHAVMSSINGIGHKSETGALDESYGDIMGSLIEGKAKDDECRWSTGEDTRQLVQRLMDTPANRSLADIGDKVYPKKYSELVAYQSDDTVMSWLEKNDDGGVHFFSTIFSHAAYLMMTRTSSITDDEWAKLFYDSMFHLTSTAKFADARNAVLVAARNHNFHPVQIQAIRKAFDDVEIYTNVSKYGYELLPIKGRVIDQNTKAPVGEVSIQVTDKQSGEEMPPATTDEHGEFLAVVFWIFSENETPTAEYFWEHYSIEIKKDGYNSVTLSSGPDTLSGSIYDIGTIQLTPTVLDDESSEFVLAKRDSSSGLTVENAASADIDIASLPEANALNVFLADFDFGFSYGADKYDFTDESVHEQVNILDRVMESYFLGNEPYEWMEITPIEPDSVQIQSQWMYFGRYKSEDVDWFLRNIFNCSDETIQKMREASGVNPDDHNYYYDDGSYYRPDIGIGGSVYPFIVSAKYDGEFYHLVYDAFSEIDFPSPYSYEGRHYAVLKLKNIDGHNYWSIYQWYKSAPENFGDVDSSSYKKASDENFWRGNYQEAVEILQVGCEKTGDSSLQERLDDMKSFFKNYENDDYHYNYYTDSYTEYPYVSPPTAVENLMGLSGFYVTSRPGGMHQQDFYVFSTAGKIIRVGEAGGSMGLGGLQDEPEGFFIRDIDGDGITELICHGIGTSSVTVYVYRMKDGIIEESSLGKEDLDRLSPPDRQEGGKREGSSWYDGETGIFYLEYSTKFELKNSGGHDTEYGYLEYHDLSPFLFRKFGENPEYTSKDVSPAGNNPVKIEGDEFLTPSVANGESNGVTWFLSNSGVLTIHGTGDMPEYDADSDGVDTPWYDMRKSITALDIKNGVTSIGSYAFFECSSLTSVTLPDSIARIGLCAFRDCTSLKKINIPDSVLNIDGWAFNGCDALKSVVVSDSTVLSETAFDESTVINYNESWLPLANSELNGEIIRSGKIGVSDDIRWSLNNKGVLRISGNGAIENYTFSYIDSIEKVNTPWWENRKDIIYVILEGNLTRIGDYAFFGLIHMARIKIPNSLESIGTGAFAGCGIQNIILPDSITNIGVDAFTECGRLTHISLPKGITSIKASTFYGCGSLSTVVIPDSVTSIGESAFFACQSLKHIHIPNTVTSIEANAFGSCDSLISIIIPQGVKKIQYGTFWKCYALVSASIPNSVTHIAPYAFSSCYNLNNVIIPDSVVEIDYSAFEYCGFTTLKIPNSITKISNGAFHGCENLNSVTLPDSVTIIEAYAFSWCIHLASINIPDSVTKIGTDAFARCDHLKNVTIPSTADISEGAFDNTTTVTRR